MKASAVLQELLDNAYLNVLKDLKEGDECPDTFLNCLGNATKDAADDGSSTGDLSEILKPCLTTDVLPKEQVCGCMGHFTELYRDLGKCCSKLEGDEAVAANCTPTMP